MIFSALGTSEPFPRLLKKLDELAGQTDEEIVVQTGKTHLAVRNCRTFDYAPSLQEYFSKARLVISHAGLGVQIELMRMHKPFLVVPRLKRYGEHFDDHQLESGEILNRRYGVRYLVDVEDLTVDLLNSDHPVIPYTEKNLNRFRTGILRVLNPEGKGDL